MWKYLALIAWFIELSSPLNLLAQSGATSNVTLQFALPEARHLYQAGQYTQAERMLQAGLANKNSANEATQFADSLELLTNIYRQLGRYGEALKTGLDYQQQIERGKPLETSNVIKRQEIAVSLAEIYAAVERYQDAAAMLSRALSLPGGMRRSDPLWETRVLALRARTSQGLGDIQAAQSTWHEVESQASAILAQIDREVVEPGLRMATTQLLTESLLQNNKPEQAVTVLNELLARQQSDDLARAQTLGEIAACYSQMHDDVKEKDFLLAALKLQPKFQDNHEQALDRIPVPPGSNQRAKPSADHADLLDRLALNYQRGGDRAEAQKCWKQAAELYEGLANWSANDDRNLGERMQQYEKLQRVYQWLGEWHSAVRVTKRLLEYRQQAMLLDDPGSYRAKSDLGALYIKTESPESAKPLLLEALKYWRSRTPPAHQELARTLNNLAEIARTNGAYTESFEYLKEAVPIYQKLYAADDCRLAEVLSNLAVIMAGKGEYKAAIGHYQLATDICRKSAEKHDQRGLELLPKTLLNTAMLYKSQRQFREAARCCEEALEARRKTVGDDAKALLPYYMALALLHLAQDPSQPSGDGSHSNLERAERLFEAAQAVCQQYELLETSSGSTLYQIKGMVHLKRAELAQDKEALDLQNAELQQAKAAFEDSRKIATTTNQLIAQAKSLNYLADVELRLAALCEANKPGAVDEHGPRNVALRRAETLSRQALNLHKSLQAYPNLHFMAHLNYARAAHALDQHDQAINELGEAIRLIESPRATTIGAESERAEYFSQFVAAFDLLVDWNAQKEDFEAALSAADAGRNRTFIDQIRAEGIDFRKSLKGTPHENLLVEETKVLDEHYYLLQRLRKGGAEIVPPAELKQMVDRIEVLRDQYANIEAKIRDANPIYRNVLGGTRESGSWSKTSRPILTDDNALLLYYLGTSKSHLFLVNGRTKEIQHYALKLAAALVPRSADTSIPLTRNLAPVLINPYLEVLRDRTVSTQQSIRSPGIVFSKKGVLSSSSGKPRLDQRQQQVALADTLLPPEVRQEISKIEPKYVIVVTDGALDQLPLEALLVKEDPAEYLIENFPPIAYAPSATIMAILQERRGSLKDRFVSLLTVGDPQYSEPRKGADQPIKAIGSPAYQGLAAKLHRLPGTLRECIDVKQAIEACGPETQVAMLSGLDATEINVREHIRDRRFIHLAAHGIVDDQHGNLFGAIALTPPKDGSQSSENDGFLSLYEIYNLPLKECELVALSACETNVGADRPLEAGSSLARAFLTAGARSVVSSHWSADDDSTAMLVSRLFKNISEELKQGHSGHYAEALKKARQDVRRVSRWEAPYYWAPFVLTGAAN